MVGECRAGTGQQHRRRVTASTGADRRVVPRPTARGWCVERDDAGVKLRRGAQEPVWIEQPLSSAQQALLRVAAETFLRTGQWPVWSGLYRSAGMSRSDADRAWRERPRVGVQESIYGAAYGLAFTPEGRGPITVASARVHLTVAGLHRSGHAPADDVVQGYLALLAAAVQAFQDLAPDPSTVAEVTLTSQQVVELGHPVALLAQRWGWELLRAEPAFAYNSPSSSESGPDGQGWSFQLSEGIERYAGATTVQAYAQVVADHVAELNASSGILPAAAPPSGRVRMAPAARAAGSWLMRRTASSINLPSRRRCVCSSSVSSVSSPEPQAGALTWRDGYGCRGSSLATQLSRIRDVGFAVRRSVLTRAARPTGLRSDLA